MTKQNAENLDRAYQEANEWINDIANGLETSTEQAAYHALRAVLFALRDRIVPEEAVHLGMNSP